MQIGLKRKAHLHRLNLTQNADPVQSSDNGLTSKVAHPHEGHRIDLNYDIHIHLPATRDQAVYDALFASLTKHLPLK